MTEQEESGSLLLQMVTKVSWLWLYRHENTWAKRRRSACAATHERCNAVEEPGAQRLPKTRNGQQSVLYTFESGWWISQLANIVFETMARR